MIQGWLYLRMWKCRYTGSTVKLYSDSQLHRESAPQPPMLFKGQLLKCVSNHHIVYLALAYLRSVMS